MKVYSHFEELGVKSPLVYGCMGLGGGWNQNPISKQDIEQTHQVIDTLLQNNINLIDHADIYTFGKAEQVFGKVLAQRPELKEALVLQSKCGIRFEDQAGPGRYDFSKEWITQSVDNILARLNIEHLPVLLLHRPDPLMDAGELGSTIQALYKSGKVGALGVSNMSADQMAFINNATSMPIVANQLEMSLSKLDWLNDTVMQNVGAKPNANFPSGTLEYCMSNNVQLQAWGSLSQGMFTGKDVANESETVKKTTLVVNELSGLYGVSKEAIVLAWLMRHPANVMPVIGTTNIDRIKACSEAVNVNLSREHWYRLFVTARGEALP